MTDAILDRIRKLVAKAQGTDNENEAATFMAKAMDMLAAHGLSMGDLPEQDRTDGFVQENWAPKYAGDTWRKSVAIAAAKVYMVRVLFTKVLVPVRGGGVDWRPGYVLVGRPVNIEVFKAMTQYVYDTIVRLGNKSFSDQRLRHQYERGAGIKMVSRLEAMYLEQVGERRQGDGSGLPALYENEVSLINEYIKANMETRQVKMKDIKAAGAAARLGFDQANDISLNTQLSPKGTSKHLLGRD